MTSEKGGVSNINKMEFQVERLLNSQNGASPAGFSNKGGAPIVQCLPPFNTDVPRQRLP